MSRRYLVASLAALLGASCTATNDDACATLDERLEKCGLPHGDAACGADESEVASAVLSRVDARGCKGVSASDDDAVDPRLCALEGWPCPASPTPSPLAVAPRGPIVLVSGIDGSPVFDWNPRIRAALRAAGIEAHHIDVLPWATTPARAADLWSQLAALRAHVGDAKVNLVCYAVGGLDCRYVASPAGLFKGDAQGYAEVTRAIASVTTIATPHRGTRVAEAALAALEDGTADDVLQTLVGALDASAHVGVPDHAALAATLRGLTPAAELALNRELVDAPGVYYQSWAGVSQVLARTSAASEQAIRAHCVDAQGNLAFQRHEGTRDAMNPLLYLSAPFSGTSLDDGGVEVSSPSDGMIAVESAKWGVFRGCLPADHYDVIGQIGTMTRDPLTGFDAPAFYTWLATDLAARGL